MTSLLSLIQFLHLSIFPFFFSLSLRLFPSRSALTCYDGNTMGWSVPIIQGWSKKVWRLKREREKYGERKRGWSWFSFASFFAFLLSLSLSFHESLSSFQFVWFVNSVAVVATNHSENKNELELKGWNGRLKIEMQILCEEQRMRKREKEWERWKDRLIGFWKGRKKKRIQRSESTNSINWWFMYSLHYCWFKWKKSTLYQSIIPSVFNSWNRFPSFFFLLSPSFSLFSPESRFTRECKIIFHESDTLFFLCWFSFHFSLSLSVLLLRQREMERKREEI